MMPSRRYLSRGKVIVALIVTAMVAGSGLVWRHVVLPQKTSPYLTASAIRMDMEESVLANGTLEALKTVAVGAQVSGQLKKLHVALGDQVKKGQLLAEIDPVLQQNSLKDAEAMQENVQAQIRAKKALLQQYELAYRRQKELADQGVTSQADLDNALAQFDATRADLAALDSQLKKARISVDTARANLDYTRIVAPMDGVVISIVTEEGQTVVAAQAAPTILKLANLDTITVKAEISEADVTRVKPGQKVYFTILGEPDSRRFGTLRAIEPGPKSSASASSAASNSSTAIYYNGLFEVPNPDGKLRVSMTAQVAIVLTEAKQVLSIPVSALQDKGKDGRQTVKVLVAGVPQVRIIKIGFSNNVNVQVIGGLREGEIVIIGEANSPVAAAGSSHPPGPPVGR